jgi:hypothetical protein
MASGGPEARVADLRLAKVAAASSAVVRFRSIDENGLVRFGGYAELKQKPAGQSMTDPAGFGGECRANHE